MTIDHRITGYDRRTDRLAQDFGIPKGQVERIRRLAGVPDADEAMVGSYPLDPTTAQQISGELSLPMDLERYEWFVEPVAEN